MNPGERRLTRKADERFQLGIARSDGVLVIALQEGLIEARPSFDKAVKLLVLKQEAQKVFGQLLMRAKFPDRQAPAGRHPIATHRSLGRNRVIEPLCQLRRPLSGSFVDADGIAHPRALAREDEAVIAGVIPRQHFSSMHS